MDQGDRVKVYHDPLMCEKLEGEAILLERHIARAHEPTELWEVEFVDDGELVTRWINIENH